jgi:hypothetical protein
VSTRQVIGPLLIGPPVLVFQSSAPVRASSAWEYPSRPPERFARPREQPCDAPRDERHHRRHRCFRRRSGGQRTLRQEVVELLLIEARAHFVST